MKFRAGFVSNSSSSNFIVIFERIPNNVDETRRALFGEERTFYYNERSYTTDYIAGLVFDLIVEQKPLASLSDVISKLLTGNFSTYPDSDDYKNEKGETNYDLWERATQREAGKLAYSFFSKKGDGVIYYFKFSDDTDEGSAMEHGDLFDKLQHERISNH